MNKKIIFKGVGTALITPFKEGEVDYSALGRLIEKQISGGVDALVIGGTTAEAATLSDGERYGIFEFARERVEGRCKLIFGTGTNDTAAAVRHTRAAERIGCDGVLVVTPYYNKGTRRGIIEHYKRISEECALPVLLYNVPSRTGVSLTFDILSELCECENIVGIKEAADSQDRLVELAEFGGALPLYAGNDSCIHSVLSLGGVGTISVISNLYPAYIKRLTSAYFDGRTDESLMLQLKAMPLIRALFKETNPVPVKYAAARLGLCENEVRLPLFTAENDTRVLLENEMARFDA